MLMKMSLNIETEMDVESEVFRVEYPRIFYQYTRYPRV